jgi:hypothetical protein
MVADFLGVKIDRDMTTGTITMSQPHLITAILKDLGLTSSSNSRALPAMTDKILHRFTDSAPHNEHWDYRSVIGKLNYLEKSTRPDIAYAVHQCTRFSASLKIERIHRPSSLSVDTYRGPLTKKEITFTPSDTSFQCFCDTGFAGDFVKSIAEEDVSTARSCTGYVLKYAGCPIICASKLQTNFPFLLPRLNTWRYLSPFAKSYQ